MAISNYICKDCKKNHICKWVDKINKFDEDIKQPIGVNITINHCDEYDEQQEVIA